MRLKPILPRSTFDGEWDVEGDGVFHLFLYLGDEVLLVGVEIKNEFVVYL